MLAVNHFLLPENNTNAVKNKSNQIFPVLKLSITLLLYHILVLNNTVRSYFNRLSNLTDADRFIPRET